MLDVLDERRERPHDPPRRVHARRPRVVREMREQQGVDARRLGAQQVRTARRSQLGRERRVRDAQAVPHSIVVQTRGARQLCPAPHPGQHVRQRSGKGCAVRGPGVFREPVLIDPLVPRGGRRELVLDEGDVRRELGAIVGTEMGVDVAHLAPEVLDDAVPRERAGGIPVGVARDGAADDVEVLVERGERAGRGGVVRAAILGGEAEARQTQVGLHCDALGGEGREVPSSGPPV
mmetsp:Transcript_6251/g.24177  ORF Transcript_6251/g.24177 Transcript_6251/m.24177 type:complete len:234 (+) Transcript_6251:457-1158(+)